MGTEADWDDTRLQAAHVNAIYEALDSNEFAVANDMIVPHMKRIHEIIQARTNG